MTDRNKGVELGTNMIDRSLEPLPRDVAGFADAQAEGLTPALPAHPPSSPLPEPTARVLLHRLGYTLAASVGATLVTLFALPTPDGQIAPVTAIGIIVVLAAGGILTRRALAAFRSRLLDEIQAGYVTTTFQQGGFWIARREGRVFAPGRNVLGWDWRGLWVLDSAGGAVSIADRAVDPPGLYPSPHRPGQRELWTGHQWAFVFPDRAE